MNSIIKEIPNVIIILIVCLTIINVSNKMSKAYIAAHTCKTDIDFTKFGLTPIRDK